MTRTDRRDRNSQMALERMKGLTIRQIAKRHGLSKSHVHRLIGLVDILPPSPITGFELVPLDGGGYTARIVTLYTPRQRAYKVRNHRRLYAGQA